MPDTGRRALPVKRNIASLVGGVVIALGCFTLVLLVASEFAPLRWPTVLVASIVAAAVGAWIRLADL